MVLSPLPLRVRIRVRTNRQKIVDAVKSTFNEFRRYEAADELSYLAVTSKIEIPFRDRLAFLLHRDHFDAGYLVAREWDRVDLAIVAPATGRPETLIEVKAAYSFDASKSAPWFVREISDDLVKVRRIGGPETDIYALLLVTHVAGKIEPRYEKVIRNSAGINRAIERMRSHEHVLAAAEQNLASIYGSRIVDHGKGGRGEAFGLEVSLFYWLIGEGLPVAP
jgi:hypothetical protein